MKLFVLISILIILGCESHKKTLTRSDIDSSSNDSLAYYLCEIYGLDQGVRKSPGMKNKWDFINPIDSINFDKIIKFIEINGFPNEKLLGNQYTHECVSSSAFSVLLHSPQRIVNNDDNLDLLIKEYNRGNLKKDAFLFVLDKYYVLKRDVRGNSKIVYGSQFGKPCLKYREMSDSLRSRIGLAPLNKSEFKVCN